MIIIKKIFFICLFILTIIFIPTNVYASENIKARIGNQFYDSLTDAINAANSNDIINLTSDASLEDTIEINKTVNINLNNKNITGDETVFLVQGGSLNLSGTGKVIETKPNYGAVMIKGSENSNDNNYSTVSIGSDIILEGWSGIFINHHNKTGYGILVNMNGTINAVDDTNGDPGAGIYINGNIKHQNNSPIINLSNTTKITSTGNGIYAAGYATYNINGAYISGEESGLGIKSGTFNILNGTIMGTGDDKTPTSGNNNGINASGTAIQIESNSSYAGNIKLDIKNGRIVSKNSNVIYEYTVKNTTTKIQDINIDGGTYISNANKEVFSLSNSLKNTHPNFISGGKYSSNPFNYLESGYSATLNDDLYEVTTNTVHTFAQKEKNNTFNTTPIIVSISLIIFGIILYLTLIKKIIFII